MRKTVVAAISLVVLTSLIFPLSVSADLSWDIQMVSNASFIGNGYSPIQVDSKGNPHIAYSGTPYASYASWNGSEWTNQKLSYGFVHDLVLDANDTPHITLGSLAYVTWNGTQWDFQTVTTDYTVYSSLTLDSSGNPHVAYISGELKYATRNGSNWTIQTVDPSPLIGIRVADSVSLALDSNDTPYIMYYNLTSYVDKNGVEIGSLNLKLANWKNSRWTIEPVLASSNLVKFGNMVLDSKGYPHFIASTGYSNGSGTPWFLSSVLYVGWNGVAWNIETVASGVDLANIGFLALSANDYPHIVYATKPEQMVNGRWTEELVYACWNGTSWESHTVDTPRRGIGTPCYLAVDSQGPHISYLKIPPSSLSNNPDRLNLMHAIANVTEHTEVSLIFPLVVVSTVVIIGTVIAVIAYVWKKKK
jgi:hypothetical protein